jgi:hypothetical protein
LFFTVIKIFNLKFKYFNDCKEQIEFGIS